MVLDWRAPLSRAFYQASAAEPQGVAVRRRFGFQAGQLTGFEDEHLDRGEELGTASRILTAEIERPRVGPMRDIVATIQPDQDVLVRADLDETICVQGAPGTGKTAVGLHRAAYLLYLHRERLRRSGVLVVGPNRAFLRYISAVLPALGEVEVEQALVDDLVRPGAGPRAGPGRGGDAQARRATGHGAGPGAGGARSAAPRTALSSRTGRGAGGSRPRRCGGSSTTYGGSIRRTRSAGSGCGPAPWRCCSARPRRAGATRRRRPGCGGWAATRRYGHSSTTCGPRCPPSSSSSPCSPTRPCSRAAADGRAHRRRSRRHCAGTVHLGRSRRRSGRPPTRCSSTRRPG